MDSCSSVIVTSEDVTLQTPGAYRAYNERESENKCRVTFVKLTESGRLSSWIILHILYALSFISEPVLLRTVETQRCGSTATRDNYSAGGVHNPVSHLTGVPHASRNNIGWTSPPFLTPRPLCVSHWPLLRRNAETSPSRAIGTYPTGLTSIDCHSVLLSLSTMMCYEARSSSKCSPRAPRISITSQNEPVPPRETQLEKRI